MFCGNCGLAIRDGKRFCSQCGTLTGKGERYCLHCGTKRDITQKFCRGCGIKLQIKSKSSEPGTPIHTQPSPPPIIKGKKYSSIVRENGKGLTIPKQVRDFLLIEPGITLVFIIQEDRVVIQNPFKSK